MPRIRTATSPAKCAAAALAAGALLISAVVAGLPVRSTAAAATATPTATAQGLPATPVSRLVLDGSTITLTAAHAATPLEAGSLDYVIGIDPSETAQSMRLQVSVFNERDILVHQRTRFVNDIQGQADTAREARSSDAAGSLPTTAPLLTERFERELSDITATPGVWTVRIDVVLSSADARSEGQLTEILTVYDESIPAAKLVPVIRVTAPPLRNPDGVFTVDPASPAQAQLRANLRAALRWLADTPAAHLTLAVSPLLIEEWRDAASGYKVPAVITTATTTPDGTDPDETPPTTTAYPSESDAAQSCAATLSELQTAVDSGRLTVAAIGYADPSLTELSAADRTADIGAQYDRGYAALGGLAAESVSAPVAVTVSSSALSALAASGVEVLILPDTAVVPADPDEVAPGLGTIDAELGQMRVIVSSAALSDIITGAESSTSGVLPPSAPLTARVAQLYRSLPLRSSAAATIDLDTQSDGPAQLLATLTTIAELQWVSLASPETASAALANTATGAATSAPTLKLNPLEAPTDTNAASEHREAVATARDASAAYLSLAPESPAAQAAYDSGLVAQNAAEVGIAGPSLADATRLEHATYAANTAQAVFDAVTIEVQAVTLPSAEGPVPITIRNDTDEVLSAELTLSPSEGLGIIGTDTSHQIEIPPQETFLDPSIRLYGVSAGELTVRLAADGYTISKQTIRVSASHIETVATIAVVAIVGFALVAYIWRRTQRAAAQDVDHSAGGGPE